MRIEIQNWWKQAKHDLEVAEKKYLNRRILLSSFYVSSSS